MGLISTVKPLVIKAGKKLVEQSPTILTGIGVAGVVTSVLLAVKATPKAVALLEEAKNNKLEKAKETQRNPDNTMEILGTPSKLPAVETIKTTWKCYIPTAIAMAISITAMIGANSINLKRVTALTALCSASEAALKQYQDKIEETFGKTKAQKVKDDINQDILKKNPIKDEQIINTGYGDALFFDKMSGRYFKASLERVRQYQAEMNTMLMDNPTLNDFYDLLNLPNATVGDMVGFDIEHPMRIDISSMLTDRNEPCTVLDYRVQPLWCFDPYGVG